MDARYEASGHIIGPLDETCDRYMAGGACAAIAPAAGPCLGRTGVDLGICRHRSRPRFRSSPPGRRDRRRMNHCATLAVIEAITSEAFWNWAERSEMPW